MARKYDSARRSQAAAQTREDILAAAFRLHGRGELSLEVLAREANVSVATIRKHFPTRELLFQGCTSYGAHIAPAPDLDSIAAEPDPARRVQLAVKQVYGMNEFLFGQLWAAFRLADASPTLAGLLSELQQLIGKVADLVIEAWNGDPDRLTSTRGAVAALLSPLTYRALRKDGGLAPDEAVAHATRLLLLALGLAEEKEGVRR